VAIVAVGFAMDTSDVPVFFHERISVNKCIFIVF